MMMMIKIIIKIIIINIYAGGGRFFFRNDILRLRDILSALEAVGGRC